MQPARLPLIDIVRGSLRDAHLVMRAMAANLLARVRPDLYFARTDLTGRGLLAEESGEEIADYAWRCFADYFQQLGVVDIEPFLDGKVLLEYGPGDFPGATLLMLAHGAHSAVCVDRFALVTLSPANQRALAALGARCNARQRDRLMACFADPARPSSGFRPERLRYVVNARGESGLKAAVDLCFSRAALEHVNALQATLTDMTTALRPGAEGLHLVDLRSHGHHRHNPLDFLRWSPRLWQLMHSAKGVPNRHRLDAYRRIVASLPLENVVYTVTHSATPLEVEQARPLVHATFRRLADADLACLGFWMRFTRARG